MRAPRGRPKKKPDYDKDESIKELLEEAVTLFQIPFDDRDERSDDAPSIRTVAEEMSISRMKVRKLLITADFYSSVLSRKVQELYGQGKSIPEICEITGLSHTAVGGYLPYKRGVYNLSELSVNAELCLKYQRRKKACERLHEHYGEGCCDDLWEAILAFEDYGFKTESGDHIRYKVEGDQIKGKDLCYSRVQIEEIFHQMVGCNSSAEQHACCGDLLYTIFLRIGACEKSTV